MRGCTMENQGKAKRSRSRERLSQLLREGGEVFSVDEAAGILHEKNEDAAKILARWCKQGWLTRVKRGFYVPVPVEASNTDHVLEDAWVLIPQLFGTAYVGGWSAAEHWDLTEQVFRDICVFTTRPVNKRNQAIQNIPFIVTHIPDKSHFGVKPLWVKERKILVSDPTKTIVDMLSDPRTGGGIQHVTDCLSQFFKSTHFAAERLIEYAERMDNRAIFKRLGFLAEQVLGQDNPLIDSCRMRLSKGNAQLDPAHKGNRLITGWRLFISVNLQFDQKSPA